MTEVRSRREVAIDLFAALPHDSVVTYEELGRALNLHPVTQRHLIQSSVYAAKLVLATEKKRSIEAIRRVGYRIRLPEEHLVAASQLQLSAGRQLTRARREVDSIDLSMMSPEGRKIALAAATALSFQQQQLRVLDLRHANLQKIIETVSTKVEETREKTEQRLRELETRIAELES